MEQARMMHGETMKGIQAGYLKVGGAQGLPNSGQLMSSGYAPPGKYDGLQGQTPEGGSEGLMAVRGQQGVNRMQRDAVTTNPKAEQLMAAHVARAAAMNGASELHKLGAALTQSMPGQSLS